MRIIRFQTVLVASAMAVCIELLAARAGQEPSPPVATTPSAGGRAWLDSLTRARLADFQGDLMLWVPAVKPTFAGDQDPVTHIRRMDERGQPARGIEAGWVWTLLLPRYPPTQRELIYQAAQKYGYTHVAVNIIACEPGGGYHGLVPDTAADCLTYPARLHTVLRELVDHQLIPICAGISPTNRIVDGLDRSLCRIVMNDWDDSDQADCRIDRMAREFPKGLSYYELPQADVIPRPDACSPAPFPVQGGTWLAAARQRAPNFAGVFYEVNQSDGIEANIAHLERANTWWLGTQQVLFETDTYQKFWRNFGLTESREHNDALLKRLPRLHGFMSGATPH